MPSPRSAATSIATETSQRHLLRNLHLYGFDHLDHLDPVILAAPADERPLLLIGAHGTAKSERERSRS